MKNAIHLKRKHLQSTACEHPAAMNVCWGFILHLHPSLTFLSLQQPVRAQQCAWVSEMSSGVPHPRTWRTSFPGGPRSALAAKSHPEISCGAQNLSEVLQAWTQGTSTASIWQTQGTLSPPVLTGSEDGHFKR